jgi:hypothetical protein
MRDTGSRTGEQPAKGAVYDPGHLLDALIGHLQLKSDVALANMLRVTASTLSKIRHRRIPVGAAMLIRMHEVSGLTIGDLRYLMGDRRKKFRLSHTQGRPRK